MPFLKNNIQRFYANILPSILFIYVIIVDSINGYLQGYYDLHTPIGVITRGIIFMLLCPVLLKRQFYIVTWLFRCLVYIYILSIPIWYIVGSQIDLSYELEYFFKFVYFFTVVLYFYYYRDVFKDVEWLLRLVIYSALIIATLNVMCFILDIGIKSYGENYGFGITAFYVDGNSLGLYMILSNCISVWYAFYKKYIWFIFAIIITCGTMLIGSRTAVLGVIIVWLSIIIYILFKHKDIIRMRTSTKVALCIMVGGVIIYDIVMITHYISTFDTFTAEKFSVESTISPRKSLIKEGAEIISKFNIVECLIGNSRSGGISELGESFLSSGEQKSIEADFHDMILCFGWFFGGLMILINIIICWRIISRYIKAPSSLMFSMSLLVILWLAVSYMAGHGFNNPMIAPLIGVVNMISTKVGERDNGRTVVW